MKKKNKDKYNVRFDEDYINPKGVASGTDCTGLVQTPPENESESEAYTDLHDIPKPYGIEQRRKEKH